MVITLLILWYLFGYVGYVWAHTKKDDLDLQYAVIGILVALAGPAAFIIIASLNDSLNWNCNPIIMKRRDRK